VIETKKMGKLINAKAVASHREKRGRGKRDGMTWAVHKEKKRKQKNHAQEPTSKQDGPTEGISVGIKQKGKGWKKIPSFHPPRLVDQKTL